MTILFSVNSTWYTYMIRLYDIYVDISCNIPFEKLVFVQRFDNFCILKLHLMLTGVIGRITIHYFPQDVYVQFYNIITILYRISVHRKLPVVFTLHLYLNFGNFWKFRVNVFKPLV